MSIVSCPQCGNKISSLAKICLHCGSKRSEFGVEQSPVFRQRQARERVYHLKMTTYAVLSVLLAAFAWYWWDSSGFQQRSSRGPFIAMGLSGIAYVTVRVFLYQAQRKLKQLRRGTM